jgi:hypothetical protein
MIKQLSLMQIEDALDGVLHDYLGVGLPAT